MRYRLRRRCLGRISADDDAEAAVVATTEQGAQAAVIAATAAALAGLHPLEVQKCHVSHLLPVVSSVV
jgi:hypothetical protein